MKARMRLKRKKEIQCKIKVKNRVDDKLAERTSKQTIKQIKLILANLEMTRENAAICDDFHRHGCRSILEPDDSRATPLIDWMFSPSVTWQQSLPSSSIFFHLFYFSAQSWAITCQSEVARSLPLK